MCSNTSRSSKRASTSFENSTRGIKRMLPKVLIEVKRKNTKRKFDKNKTQYVRHSTAFTAPSNPLGTFESIKSKILLSTHSENQLQIAWQNVYFE